MPRSTLCSRWGARAARPQISSAVRKVPAEAEDHVEQGHAIKIPRISPDCSQPHICDTTLVSDRSNRGSAKMSNARTGTEQSRLTDEDTLPLPAKSSKKIWLCPLPRKAPRKADWRAFLIECAEGATVLPKVSPPLRGLKGAAASGELRPTALAGWGQFCGRSNSRRCSSLCRSRRPALRG